MNAIEVFLCLLMSCSYWHVLLSLSLFIHKCATLLNKKRKKLHKTNNTAKLIIELFLLT